MTERPILFSAPMVRALLAGTKTVTRRLVDLDQLRVRLPYGVESEIPAAALAGGNRVAARAGIHRAGMNQHGAVWAILGESQKNTLGLRPGEFDFCCPYIDGGTTRLRNGVWHIEPHGEQRLWVRESIRRNPEDEGSHFIADGSFTKADCWPWKNKALPAIHCPKGLSRITLEVTGVRVERLQAITEEDARAEGMADPDVVRGLKGQQIEDDYRGRFQALWGEINGERAPWSSNLWVWVVEFRPVEATNGR